MTEVKRHVEIAGYGICLLTIWIKQQFQSCWRVSIECRKLNTSIRIVITNPNEWDTTSEHTSTSTENVSTVFLDIPTETYTWTSSNSCSTATAKSTATVSTGAGSAHKC